MPDFWLACNVQGLQAMYEETLTRAETAETKLDAAEQALEGYGQHTASCAVYDAREPDDAYAPCSCRLDAALTRLRGSKDRSPA